MASLPLICSWILDDLPLRSPSPFGTISRFAICARTNRSPDSLRSVRHHWVWTSAPSFWILVYGIRGPTFLHRSVTGMEEIMSEGGDLHALLPPMDAFPILQYVRPTRMCDKLLRFIRILPDISRISSGGGESPSAEWHRVARRYTRVLLCNSNNFC